MDALVWLGRMMDDDDMERSRMRWETAAGSTDAMLQSLTRQRYGRCGDTLNWATADRYSHSSSGVERSSP